MDLSIGVLLDQIWVYAHFTNEAPGVKFQG